MTTQSPDSFFAPAGRAGEKVLQHESLVAANSQVITTSYAIPSGKNASSTGPLTVNGSVTITIPSGSRWVIL